MNPKSLTLFFAVLLAAAAPGDKAKVQGLWFHHRLNVNGEDLGISPNGDPDVMFGADGHVEFYGQKIGRYTLDESKHWIDIMPERGFEAGKTLLGMYKLEGETLTIIQAEPSAKRPTDFTPGAGRQLTVYRRQPKK